MLAHGDVVIAGAIDYVYDSGAGATGVVRFTSNYTLASPISLTSSNLFLNVTGKTANVTEIPSGQLQFRAWNTSNTGTIPIVVQSAVVKATYVLNAASYSYVNPNITISTLLSNQTVTVDFNLLGGYSIYVYSCSGTLASAPTYVANTLTIVVTDSGAGAATTTLVSGMGEAPYLITQDGTPPALANAVVWASATDILTITGLGTWVLGFHQTIIGPPTPSPPSGSIGSLQFLSPLTVTQGERKNTTLSVIVTTQLAYMISKVTFNQSWVTAYGLPRTYTGSQKILISVTLDARNATVGHYSVRLTFQWKTPDGLQSETQTATIFVDVVAPFGFLPPSGSTSSDRQTAHRQTALLVAGIAGASLFLIYARRRRKNGE